MNLDQAWQTFFAECAELLEEMESALLSIGHGDQCAELIRVIFRAAHTIKGSAGLFGLDGIVAFTHDLESVLDEMREGRVPVNARLVELLLSCRDHVGRLVDHAAAHPHPAGERAAPDAELVAEGIPLSVALRGYLAPSNRASAAEGAGTPGGEREGARVDARVHAGAGAGDAADLPARDGVDAGASAAAHDTSDSENWHISLRFGEDVLRHGMDPLSFIHYLQTVAEIVTVETLVGRLPVAAEMDPETCYLSFEIVFRSAADKATIENVFEFVRDDCDIRILPPHSRMDDYLALIRDCPESENVRLGEILVRCGTLTARELENALAHQAAAAAASDEVPLLGDLLVDQGAVQPKVVAAALDKQRRVSHVKAQENRSVRVDSDKLDRLIDLVGELTIAGASIGVLAQRGDNIELLESVSTLATLVQDVRDSALQLRMVKIGSTFSKFQRVVHDVSAALGKDIVLETAGEDTELDKAVIEKIGDPLMHLIRNAMDHGIESVARRRAQGKPDQGTVRLNAYHEASHIVIEIVDDGAGLNRDKIFAKAVERGLVDAGKTLSDREVFELIFEPGFSTADAVTNLSGRGVGMDVVKSNVLALRGSVTLDSKEGLGTVVRVTLPLTLAIIDGFLVEVADSIFVLPLSVVEECIEFAPAPDQQRDYLDLRGSILPFARLRDVFELTGAQQRRENVVVIRHAGRRFGLVVDRLLGEFQTVIKPLSRLFEKNRLISGSAILGSGRVALILDVGALAQRLEQEASSYA
ncbi:chemotaxis protein CheA [Robbsia sp. Bb-Pol-6]|uniref:Chemotaxis protein CheA n=1 Tax=Robbsia betulipollinis TaxID=2981849 RepID=A0ABT3ZGT7_9BURK|nr:chemotaxis protein CheA [Robbsia betulipollinis]MCY0385739.1 chemotaxis protein CheA [Robbsia betulipollinis]